MIEKALLSVSNKEKIIDLAKELNNLNIELISTGGTCELIQKSNIKCVSVSKLTGFPEILNGRVKTLHPIIYGAILAKKNDLNHINNLKQKNIKRIDMLVVNLYPFKQAIKKDDLGFFDVMEYIDIGGVSLLRAGAKNFENVIVVSDINDYSLILSELKKTGIISKKYRFELAKKAFQITFNYDKLIYKYFNKKSKIFY